MMPYTCLAWALHCYAQPPGGTAPVVHLKRTCPHCRSYAPSASERIEFRNFWQQRGLRPTLRSCPAPKHLDGSDERRGGLWRC